MGRDGDGRSESHKHLAGAVVWPWAGAPQGVPGCFGRLSGSRKLTPSEEEKERIGEEGSGARQGAQRACSTPHTRRVAVGGKQ